MSVAASLIATTMNASTPLLLAALGILVAERSGRPKLRRRRHHADGGHRRLHGNG